MHLRYLAPLCLSVAVLGCQQSDPEITQMVRSALVSDDLVRTRNIRVDTRQQVVTLTGTVATAAEKDRAMRLARFAKGVHEVKDEIRIVPEAVATTGVLPPKLAIDDATIVAAIRTKLLANPDTAALTLDVQSRDHVVTLKGMARSTIAHETALLVASSTDGVVRVEDQMTLASTPGQ